jgi:RNA polymerase sigma-70 factor (ECF subfamily)
MSRAEAPPPVPVTVAAPPPEATGDQDGALVERSRAGDTGAFEMLVRRYQGWVFTLAVRMLGDRAEAEDMAQEIFLKAYRGLKNFKGTSRFSTWLYAIASHHCLNQIEARRRRPLLHGRPGRQPDHSESDTPTVVDRLADQAPRADALLEQTDLARIVQAELANLTAEHRVILILRDIQGLSYEEIAQTLQLELGTVRSRLHRARMEMRVRLTPHV